MITSLPFSTARNNRIAVSVFFFISGITFASWACRIPDFKAQLQLSDAGLGSVLFAIPVGLMASLPLAGYLVGKFGSRHIVLLSALLYPFTLLLLSFITSTLQLAVCLFFFGLFANLMNIAINTQAVGVEANYGRSVMASFHGVWSLAGFTGALIGTFLISQKVSITVHYSIIGGINLLLIAVFFRHTLQQDFGQKNQPLFALPDKNLLVLGLIAFGCMVCEGTMFDWSGVYFQKVVAVPKAYTTLGYTAFMGSMAAGRFMGDKLVIVLGKKRMIQISGITITAGLLLAIFFPVMSIATFGFLLVGLGVSSVVPIVYGAAGKSGTMSPGAAIAAVSTIGFVGFLLGPPVIGFIAEAANLRWSFGLIALLGLSTTFLASTVRFK